MTLATLSPIGLTLCRHVHLATAARIKYSAAYAGYLTFSLYYSTCFEKFFAGFLKLSIDFFLDPYIIESM